MITLALQQRSSKRFRRSQPRLGVFLHICEAVSAFAQQQAGLRSVIYFAFKEGGLHLYLLTEAEVYNFELSGKLAEFAAPYIARGVLDSASLLPASSAEEMEAFLDPKFALRVEIEHA